MLPLPAAAQSGTQARFEVLDPRGAMPPITRVPLAPRLANLNGKRITILRSWNDNSGFDQAIEQIAGDLRKRGAKVAVRDRNVTYSQDDPQLWKELHATADGFVYVAAASSSTTAYAFRWSDKLEGEGLPGVVVNFSELNSVGDLTNARFGTDVRRAVFDYPPEKMAAGDLDKAISAVALGLTAPLTADERKTGIIPPPQRPEQLMSGTLSEVQDRFYDMGLTDGLPIVPPTPAAVAAMLKGTRHAPDEVVAKAFAPEELTVTVRAVAINGVMAGCRAEHLPVLLATVEAFQKYNLNAILRSTNNFSFMQVVNGPIRDEIKMNSGTGALGPGNRSNSCMGRALRLFVTNLGDGHFDRNLMAVIGNPTNYALMFAENEEMSPWPSLAVEQGFTKKDSVLTFFTGGWGFTGNYGLGTAIEDVPADLARIQLPGGAVLIVSPARAKALSAAGMSKEKLETFLQTSACRTLGDLRKEGRFQDVADRAGQPDSVCVPRFAKGTVKVIVAGNAASPMMQAWHMQRPQSVSIDRWR